MPQSGDQVRSALVSTIKAAGDVAVATRVAVKDVVVGGLKDAGEMAANAAIFAGTVKSAVIGVSEAGRGATDGVRGAVGGVIHAAAEVGSDLAQASASAMKGVLEAAAELGQDSRRYVRVAVEEMLEAASSIGEQAVTSVKRGLMDVASIPRDMIEAALKGVEEDEGPPS